MPSDDMYISPYKDYLSTSYADIVNVFHGFYCPDIDVSSRSLSVADERPF